MAILTVTVEPELKKAYLAACREDGCSGAQVIRAAMQTIVDGSRDPGRLRAALRLDVDHPVPPGKSCTCYASCAAGNRGIVGLVS